MSLLEVKVPDIGEFTDVEVIEILVKVGDVVIADQSLVTVESDKASMEIPSSGAGVVREVKIKLGEKVSEGSILAILESSAAVSEPLAAPRALPTAAPTAVAGASAAPRVAPAAVFSPTVGRSDALANDARAQPFQGKVDRQCGVLVLGSGPGGYSAAFRAADLGMDTVLVERYPNLGGVCLNVGCIPSKALLHVAAVVDEAKHLSDRGVTFGAPAIDLDKLRGYKDKVVGKLTGGLAMMARARQVTFIQGLGAFLDDHHVSIQTPQGPTVVRFEHAIIAAGSEAARLPFAPSDARIVDSTGALQLPFVPKKMLVIGGGIIGLEMGTVYSSLGARLDVVEVLDGLMQGADRDLVKVWQKMNGRRFDRTMLKTRTVGIDARADGVWVRFEGEQAPTEAQRYDLVLQSVGRIPNGHKIGAAKAGVQVTQRGFIEVDRQMHTNVPHIYAIGDVVGQPMLAHKATHQGHVAAAAAAGEKAYFDARVIPSVAYTDPEIAWVGMTEDEARLEQRSLGRAVFPWAASGRAIANGRDEGFTKLLFDESTHRLVGAAIVGTNAGDLISELALAIEMGADAVDIGRTIHPHPTLSESVGMAAEIYEGVCTDVPPARKK